MKKWNLWLLVASALVLSACAARPPMVTQYVLAEPSFDVVDHQFDGKFAIGSIRMAEYLKGNGLVIAESASELRRTRMHRWAERLEAQVERQLRLGLSQQFPNSQWVPLLSTGYLRNMDYRVDLHVDAFHLTAERDVTIQLQWFVRDAQEDFVHNGRVVHNEPMSWPEDDDADVEYAAFITTMSEAWHLALLELGKQLQQVKTDN